jgi:hypothetical protein
MKLYMPLPIRARAVSAIGLVFLAGASLFVQAGGVALAAEKTITWKPNSQAMLRVDDSPLQEWSVYEAGKKTNSGVLLQMGSRYLFIDRQKRQIFELDPSKLEHKGTDLLWDPADHPEKPLEASNWVVKDVGQAYRVNVRLVAENHVIDVQIPHPLDLRYIH